nr:serine/arginine repetitive matrix protein 1-like [Aegilops tauschii subsp. strangulata]
MKIQGISSCQPGPSGSFPRSGSGSPSPEHLLAASRRPAADDPRPGALCPRPSPEPATSSSNNLARDGFPALLCRSRQCLVCLPYITPRRRELVPKSRQRRLAKSSPSPPPVPKLRRRLPQSLSPSSSTVPEEDDALLSVSSAKSLASLPRRRSKSSSSPSPGNRSTSARPSPPPPDLVHSVAQPPVSFAASSSTSSDRGG